MTTTAATTINRDIVDLVLFSNEEGHTHAHVPLLEEARKRGDLRVHVVLIPSMINLTTQVQLSRI